MKTIYLALAIMMLNLGVQAQHQVTLKVIDNQNGELTNKVNDNNETNVFLWAADTDGNLIYTRGDADWWYAMYSGETQCPNGELIKANGVWTWQATFNVAPGDYNWNPHMKTLGWKPINTLYNYASENNISFTVGSDGTISGQTTLELPLVPTALEPADANQTTIKVINQRIILTNLKQQCKVSVYNLSGQVIKTAITHGAETELPVNQPGIYIIKAGNQTFKTMIK